MQLSTRPFLCSSQPGLTCATLNQAFPMQLSTRPYLRNFQPPLTCATFNQAFTIHAALNHALPVQLSTTPYLCNSQPGLTCAILNQTLPMQFSTRPYLCHSMDLFNNHSEHSTDTLVNQTLKMLHSFLVCQVETELVLNLEQTRALIMK